MLTSAGLASTGCNAPSEDASADAPSEVVRTAAPTAPSELEHDAGDATTPAGDASDDAVDAFLGEPDAPRLEVLRHGAITRIERGSGGRSVAFRLTFEDGSRGYFKPEQSVSSTRLDAEIAAYHVDRLLGLGRTPPTVTRSLPFARLREVWGASDARLAEIVVQRDGTVRGTLSYWVPERLVTLTTGRGFERWFRVEGPPFLTPFQRATRYIAQASHTQPITPTIDEDGEPIEDAGEPDVAERGAELSDLVLFDYLTHNIDRWGGRNTNVRTRGEHGPLVFLDNAAGFSPGRARIGYMDTRLETVQRFRRRTIEAIRAFDADALVARLAQEDAPVELSATQLAQLEERRAFLLAHVDRTRGALGDEAVLAW